MRIGLVGCTKSKLDRAAPARDLYSPSALFRGRLVYVERTCERWYILSAKYGLVAPEDVLEPYDETLVGKPIGFKRTWSLRVMEDIRQALGDLSRLDFEVHAGANYWAFGLRDALVSRAATVEIITEHLGQGEQLAFYAGYHEPRPTRLKAPTRGGAGTRGSYGSLREHLDLLRANRVSFSFVELEDLLGRVLPASARQHRAWWANDLTHSHARSWLDIHWKVCAVNLTAERVTFLRIP